MKSSNHRHKRANIVIIVVFGVLQKGSQHGFGEMFSQERGNKKSAIPVDTDATTKDFVSGRPSSPTVPQEIECRRRLPYFRSWHETSGRRILQKNRKGHMPACETELSSVSHGW